MSVVVDVGDRRYYEMRAFELAREAGESLEIDKDSLMYHAKMKMAMSLLALARAVTSAEEPVAV